MRRGVFVILSLLATLSVSAQYTICGYLFDAGTKETLISAYVRVAETGQVALTNAEGYYTLQFQAEGPFTLEATYVGYEASKASVKATKRTRQNFYLSESGTQLSEVVVNSTGFTKSLETPQMGVEKLSIGQIRKIPAFMGEVDVIKSFQLLPGVQSTSEGSSSFSVRGGAPDQNLILLDGATIYNASHLMGFFSVFNNDIIDNATLYKGDIPATQGGRISSLLEIDTKEGSNDAFSGRGGIGLISSRLMLEGPLVKDRLTAWISGRVFYAGMFLPLIERLKKTRLTFYDVNARLSAKLSDKHRLSFSGYAGQDYFALSGTGNFNYANQAMSLRWNAIVNDNFYIATTVANSWYQYTGSGALSGLSAEWKSRIADYGFRQEYTWNIDSHNKLKFGLSTSFKQIHTGDASMFQSGIDNTLSIAIPMTQNLESAFFVGNEQTYGPVSMNYGVRLSIYNNIGPQDELLLDDDHNKIGVESFGKGKFYNTYFNAEPRFSISYNFVKSMSLKASYSRSAQNLHLIQTTTAGSPLDVWRGSDKNLKPTTCNQWALGYVWNFWDDRFQFSLEGYYKQLNNVVDFKDFANVMLNADIDAEIVSGKGRAYGVEVMLKKEVGSVTGWVSYAYSRSLQTIAQINGGREYSSFSDRPHSVNIVLNYNIAGWVDLGATWVYATGQPMSAPESSYEFSDFGETEVVPVYTGRNQYRKPDYHRLDLSVTFDLNKGVKKKYNHDINISFYNVYCRHNAWMIEFTTDPETKERVADMTYLFSIVPSVTYNFSF